MKYDKHPMNQATFFSSSLFRCLQAYLFMFSAFVRFFCALLKIDRNSTRTVQSAYSLSSKSCVYNTASRSDSYTYLYQIDPLYIHHWPDFFVVVVVAVRFQPVYKFFFAHKARILYYKYNFLIAVIIAKKCVMYVCICGI